MAKIVVLSREADREAYLADHKGLRVTWLTRRIFSVESAPARALSDPRVESVEDDKAKVQMPDQTLSLDVGFGSGSWPLARVIRRKAPWNVDRLVHPVETFFRCARDGSGVDVYFLDSGINTVHPEFGGRATNVYLPFGSLGEGHGTMTASAAAGETCGFARGSEVFCFQWLNSAFGFAADAITALGEIETHYLARSGLNRPAVLALEIEGTGTSPGMSSAVSDLIDAGMVCLGAAGNEGVEIGLGTHFPMTYTGVICVGGIGPADIPAYFSRPDGRISRTNWGSRVDVMAPGQHQRGAAWDDDEAYTLFGGSTSGALAVATGVVACMLQGHDRLSSRTEVAAVRAHVIGTATTGRFRNPPQFELTTLPDRILYLDPDATFEAIPGLS